MNASSIGMAVAALQALDELNLFGICGGTDSIVHVMLDEVHKNKAVLHSMLPRYRQSLPRGTVLYKLFCRSFFSQRIPVKRGGFCSADGDRVPSFRCREAGRDREDDGCGDEQTQPRIRMHSIPQGRLQNTQRRFVKVRSTISIPEVLQQCEGILL